MSGQEWRLRAVCRAAPDLWFAADRVQLAQAIHLCRQHCPVIGECAATESPPIEGVLAGVLYNFRGEPHGKQPAEVPCGGCIAATPNRFNAPRPDPEEGCGKWGGVKRHQKRRERLCHPCAAFHNARRMESRAAKRAVA